MNEIIAQILQSFSPQSIKETWSEVRSWFTSVFASALVQELLKSFTSASLQETFNEVKSWLPRLPKIPKKQPVLSPFYAPQLLQRLASLPERRSIVRSLSEWATTRATAARYWIATHRRGLDEFIDETLASLTAIRRPAFRFAGNFMIVASFAGVLLLSAPFLALELRTAVFKLTQPFLTDAQPNQKPIALPEDITPEPDRQFRVRIPLIGVEANVTPNVDVSNPDAYEEALQHGLAHAKGTGFPDSDGGVNKSIFVFSHSTNGSWNITRYNALFYSLKDLEVDSQIQVWFWGKEYWYKVTEKRVVESSDVSFLEPQMDKEKLILQTCWPPGTLDKRMIITAERIESAQ